MIFFCDICTQDKIAYFWDIENVGGDTTSINIELLLKMGY